MHHILWRTIYNRLFRSAILLEFGKCAVSWGLWPLPPFSRTSNKLEWNDTDSHGHLLPMDVFNNKLTIQLLLIISTNSRFVQTHLHNYVFVVYNLSSNSPLSVGESCYDYILRYRARSSLVNCRLCWSKTPAHWHRLCWQAGTRSR